MKRNTWDFRGGGRDPVQPGPPLGRRRPPAMLQALTIAALALVGLTVLPVLYADHRPPSPSGNDGLQAPATTRPAASDAGLELAVPADPPRLAVEPPAAAQAPDAGTGIAAPSADRDQAASAPASPARAAPAPATPAAPVAVVPPTSLPAPPLVPLPGEDPGDFADRVQLAKDDANDRLDDLRD